MKTFFKSMLTVLITLSFCQAQDLEVIGKAKISTLTKDNAASEVVIILADGNLGKRDVSSLPTGGGGGGASSFIVGGGSSFNGFGTADNFIPMASSVRANSFEEVKTRVSMAGSITKFEGAIKGATAAGSYTFHILKNGTDTNITCVITGATTYSCTDLSNCVQFVEGDYVAVRYTGSGATNREGRWSAIFTPGGGCP